MGLGYNLITIRAIWNHYIYKQNMQLMNFIFLFDQIMILVIGAANLFHWTIAMTGMSTVDVLCGGRVIINIFNFLKGQNSFVSATGKKHRLTFRSIRDNLYKVFGT